jgi:hypothetical protein
MPRANRKAETPQPEMIGRIVAAVRQFDLRSDPAWSDLDLLSSNTVLESIEVDPEGVVLVPGGRFAGVMNVYVLLQYDPGSADSFTDSDSFLGQFEGYVDAEENPVIEQVSVDTTPFFGEDGKGSPN